MAALVQSYPQQSGTVTMLQARPSSAGGMGQPHGNSQYGSSQQRASFHGHVGGAAPYRGSSAPIQPYAFTSTPSLNPNPQWQQYGAMRTSSTPAVPTVQQVGAGYGPDRTRYPAAASTSNLPSMSTITTPTGYARDDSSLPVTGRRVTSNTPRPQSTYLSGSNPQLQFMAAVPTPAKASPERYRRPAPRVIDTSAVTSQTQGQGMVPPSSGMTTSPHMYNSRGVADQKSNVSWKQSSALPSRPNSFYAAIPAATVDDMQLYKHNTEETKRFRRRSMPTLDSADFLSALTPPHLKQAEEATRQAQLAQHKSGDKDKKSTRPVPAPARSAVENTVHSRTGSSESVVSTRSSNNSRPSSATNRNSNVSTPANNPASHSSVPEQSNAIHESPNVVSIPPRGSSSDAAKRVTNPSPLSRPVTMDTDEATFPSAAGVPGTPPAKSAPSPTKPESPAVRQLAAINQKGKAKSKTSRLRRAFSFGSAAELRKMTNQEEDADASLNSNAPLKLHKKPTADELYDAEQARIAQKQEEAGIGSSIYAGARIFAGSTDNLSISSTASSASIMIRKMGRGMKKGGRSLVGLFRPKSVIGVPAADGPVPDVSQPAVSMITVEAERERVNVNPDPHTQNGGGTGFPRLERNSIDASKAPSSASERLGSSGTDSSAPRKSIVGGELERAEVLAAVRKGILKNTSGSSSPARTPNDKAPVLDLPNIPHVADSPSSSAPSTPNDEAHGHKRNGSIAIGSEDYFMSALRLRQDTKSAPGTPQGMVKRNATFSPRIVFYDTWPSQEYDRRGEIATCNRLTPMLAQQIKEELNSFKMEMEVHENSKIYTHFF